MMLFRQRIFDDGPATPRASSVQFPSSCLFCPAFFRSFVLIRPSLCQEFPEVWKRRRRRVLLHCQIVRMGREEAGNGPTLMAACGPGC